MRVGEFVTPPASYFWDSIIFKRTQVSGLLERAAVFLPKCAPTFGETYFSSFWYNKPVILFDIAMRGSNFSISTRLYGYKLPIKSDGETCLQRTLFPRFHSIIFYASQDVKKSKYECLVLFGFRSITKRYFVSCYSIVRFNKLESHWTHVCALSGAHKFVVPVRPGDYVFTVAPIIYELSLWSLLHCYQCCAQNLEYFPRFWKIFDRDVYWTEVWYLGSSGFKFRNDVSPFSWFSTFTSNIDRFTIWD